MPNQDLLNYIKEEKNLGIDNQTITNNLLSKGWKQAQIDEAFAPNIPTPLPPLVPNSPNENHSMKKDNNSNMWDAFEHILMFISLYVMATSIGLLLNYFVDRWFPPITNNVYNSSYNGYQSTIVNGYIAALIVSMPLFVFLFVVIQKRTMENPAIIHNLQTRKSLIYLTLVITFIIMLIQIIGTIYNFLNGNISINFILHFLVITGISGIIFAYYMLQVKGDRKVNE